MFIYILPESGNCLATVNEERSRTSLSAIFFGLRRKFTESTEQIYKTLLYHVVS